MNSHSQGAVCLQCQSAIEPYVLQYALKKYKFALCEDCQLWFIGKVFHSTHETLELYFALRNKGVPVDLSKYEEYKTMDISVSHSNIHIKVEADLYRGAPEDVIAALVRNNTGQDGPITLHIPENLVRFNIEKTTDIVKRYLLETLSLHSNRN